ncbi:ABC transporter ATP-binding protein/permease [Phytomonospora endophytica]|uniref:Mycobactin import ATP-binding/permease protein IrtA n=1 Tax=Phytomonospora endophytica TaxID=714109 RepID=A0A841FLA7_9ACTN|nr:ATP-binding cassette domain-containing protein [Phytomonospora endophytica]MBB6034332.1 ATP-binding cassette subfamily B protein IrtA [Phytomonospora endophytica]GIG66726.1 hypothetical ABC transporter ATP-binding protein [Phytomonospora endophytica]
MARGFQGAMLKALGAGDHVLEVLSVEDLTRHYRRIVFSAPTLFDRPFETAGYLRLWVPDAAKPGRHHQRGYTIVAPDEAAGTITLEFAMHASGPAVTWAASVEPGERITASRYGSTKFAVGDPVPDGYVLIGDTAAIPALNSVLAVLPDDVPVEVLLERSHDDDVDIPMTPHPGMRVTWVPQTGDPAALADALGERDWSNWYAWVTAESAATRRVRGRLKEFGFPRSEIHAQAYWMRGRAMGTKHDAETPAVPSPRTEAIPAETPKPREGWRSRAGSTLLAPLKGRLILAGAVQAVVSLLQLAPFVVLVELCRRVLSGDADERALRGLGLLALVLFLSGTVLALLLITAMHVLDARFGHEVRTAIVAKLPRLPLGWFTERSSGRVKQAVADDAANLHYLVTHAVLDVVAAVVTPLAVLGYLFAVEPLLATVLLIPLAVFGILTARMVSASSAAIPAAVEWTARAGSEAIAYLDGLPVVRAYDLGPGGRLRATLEKHAAFLEGWQRPLLGRRTATDLVTRPSTSLLVIAAAGTGLVIAGVMSPVDLLPFLLLGVTFSTQLLAIGYGLGSLREAVAAARRIGLVLTEPELAAEDTPGVLPAVGGGRSVRFASVSFAYKPGHPVVSDVDIELRPGTVTALVGPSGAGKSTLAALLARFHDVTAGAITIDGTDLRALSTEELYATVGFVFQQVSVLDASVRDNIALARPGATDAEIEAAARAALIHERVERLPDGYDTVLGRAARLSGGEEQRLQIARAILADPKVLVLDEATAFADPESEFQVQRALSRLIAGRTVLVIAHRLHTVTDADAIAVLDGGRLVQYGTHPELVARPGLYRELWTAAGATREQEAHA